MSLLLSIKSHYHQSCLVHSKQTLECTDTVPFVWIGVTAHSNSDADQTSELWSTLKRGFQFIQTIICENDFTV